MKLIDVLPIIVKQGIADFKLINEIRFRLNKGVVILKNGVYSQLLIDDKPIICAQQMLTQIVNRACNNSVYAYSTQIKQGFISLEDGSRIGLCGDVVVDSADFVSAMRNITSLNIRVPHSIFNCSASLYKHYAEPISSSLVISPPGCGKTTFLRDMIFKISVLQPFVNILVADERNEIVISQISDTINEKLNCDTYCFCNKQYAFTNGIRSMAPDVVVTDEISTSDIKLLREISNSGVRVFASIHADSIEQLDNKIGLKNIETIFKYYIVLSRSRGIGTLEGIFDNKGVKLAI